MRHICVFLIAATACTAAIDPPHRPVAAEASKISIPEAGGEVSAERRERGVVHISAATQQSLFFAQGYIHALDRFFQMDVFRRRAAGTLAELLGQARCAVPG